MGEGEPREVFIGSLATIGFRKQVSVEGHEDPPEFRSPIHQRRIIQLPSSILRSRENVTISQPESECDGARHMMVQVEAEGHQAVRSRANRVWSRDGAMCFRIRSVSARRRSTSRSSSS